MSMMMMVMVTQHIPTMTKTHPGGNLSVMNKVGICRCQSLIPVSMPKSNVPTGQPQSAQAVYAVIKIKLFWIYCIFGQLLHILSQMVGHISLQQGIGVDMKIQNTNITTEFMNKLKIEQWRRGSADKEHFTEVQKQSKSKTNIKN